MFLLVFCNLKPSLFLCYWTYSFFNTGLSHVTISFTENLYFQDGHVVSHSKEEMPEKVFHIFHVYHIQKIFVYVYYTTMCKEHSSSFCKDWIPPLLPTMRRQENNLFTYDFYCTFFLVFLKGVRILQDCNVYYVVIGS